MKGSARACLLTLGASVAGCSSADDAELRTAGATVDLLARGPEQTGDAAGVTANLAARSLRLEPGAGARYRVEVRVPGRVSLAGRAASPGKLEVAWWALDLAAGVETPSERREFELSAGKVARDFALPAGNGLFELRLAWSTASGGAGLELGELALCESEPVARPSIVLIVIDTLSAEHLSAYGYPLETDPELVRFASESILFEHCYSNAPWTVPSFMALMTGLYSRAHQLAPGGPELWQQWYLAENRWTLAESVRAAGYRTAGYVDNHFLAKELGFAQGFDVYDERAAADNNSYLSDPAGGLRMTAALALAFLQGLGPKVPGFVFVHAFDVHQPYTERPTPEERAHGTEPYDPDRRVPVGGSNWTYGIIPTLAARVEQPEGELPAEMPTAPIERAYDEGIRFLDGELGKFLAGLRASGELERAWVVFTADHGETMGEGVHFFAHGLLTQEVVHVPLVIRPPGGAPGGKRIAEVVQLADLYPTLIELAGGAADAHLLGRSLVPLLRGEERSPDVVLTESGITRQAMLVAGGWKLVELEPTRDSPPEARISHPLLAKRCPPRATLEARRGRIRKRDLKWLDDPELCHDFFELMPATGLTEELLAEMKTRPEFPSFLAYVDHLLQGPFYELYDLTADPKALHDIAAEHPEKVAELRTLLEQEKSRRKAAWELAQRPLARAELPPEEIQALEALGYGGGGEDPDEHEDDRDGDGHE